MRDDQIESAREIASQRWDAITDETGVTFVYIDIPGVTLWSTDGPTPFPLVPTGNVELTPLESPVNGILAIGYSVELDTIAVRLEQRGE